MDKIKELLSRIGLQYRLEVAFCEVIEQLEQRAYALEQNRKIKDAEIARLQKEVGEIKLILRKKVQ